MCRACTSNIKFLLRFPSCFDVQKINNGESRVEGTNFHVFVVGHNGDPGFAY